MDHKNEVSQPSFVLVLTVLRIAIGWHFLYEGIVKLVNPDWTSAAFLVESRWIFSDVFHWIVSNQTALAVVDFMNIWGLVLIGLGLIVGLFSRTAAISGLVLLSLYFIAMPPILGYTSGVTEGNYLLVTKNLVEMLSLAVLVLFPIGSLWGLDRLMARVRAAKAVIAHSEEKPVEDAASCPGAARLEAEDERKLTSSAFVPRRELIKNLISVPVLGGFVYAYIKRRGWESHEERILKAAGASFDAVSSATMKTFQFSSLKDLKEQVPQAQLGNLKLSRVFLGGNLIGGWAHARDLIYVSKMVKAYHTDEKVFETFRLAEQCGINTIIGNPIMARVINKYRRTQGGKMQWISDCCCGENLKEGVPIQIESGANAIYIEGQVSEEKLDAGRIEEVGEAVELIKQYGLPAGIGAHRLEVVKTCVDLGIKPDFWVKTLHHHNYWSARPEIQPVEPWNLHDNIWCVNPEETIEYMNNLDEPWIAFKTLAAGAIHPQEGLRFAFENGADFVALGMYDFQLVENANITTSILAGDFMSKRERRWMA